MTRTKQPDPTPAATPQAPPRKHKRVRAFPKKDGGHFQPGHGAGRREVPWEAMREVYVHGRLIDCGNGQIARSWPSANELARMFSASSHGVLRRISQEEWEKAKTEFQRKLAEEADARVRAYQADVGKLWNEAAEASYNASLEIIRESKYSLHFHRSGRAAAMASRGRRKPGGGDSASQGAASGGASPDDVSAEEMARAQVGREPMPGLELKNLAAAVKGASDNIRALLVGVGTTTPGASSSPAQGAAQPEAPNDPRVAIVVDSFVKHMAAQARTPDGEER